MHKVILFGDKLPLCRVSWTSYRTYYWWTYNLYVILIEHDTWDYIQTTANYMSQRTIKTYKMVCAPSEDSDQSGNPPSLIRIFAVRMKKAWVSSYPLST